MRFLVALLLLSLLGCGGNNAGDADAAVDGGPDVMFSDNPPTEVGGDRPAAVISPDNYDPANSYPLVILLHGFGASGPTQAAYFTFPNYVSSKQFILIAPDGTEGPGGRFWNATPACCGFGTEVDDVAYIRGLISETKTHYNVDGDRVYIAGHSNGGFMAYRMACEASDVVTAIMSLAGATFETEQECAPQTLPVSVLQVHGTADGTIGYDGGMNATFAYPSAPESVRRFAAAAGCNTESTTMLDNLDLVATVEGAETTVLRYETGCASGIDAELWSSQGGPHIPALQPNFAPDVLDWLFSHSR